MRESQKHPLILVNKYTKGKVLYGPIFLQSFICFTAHMEINLNSEAEKSERTLQSDFSVSV